VPRKSGAEAEGQDEPCRTCDLKQKAKKLSRLFVLSIFIAWLWADSVDNGGCVAAPPCSKPHVKATHDLLRRP
jgi:hypothetical protein